MVRLPESIEENRTGGGDIERRHGLAGADRQAHVEHLFDRGPKPSLLGAQNEHPVTKTVRPSGAASILNHRPEQPEPRPPKARKLVGGLD